MVLVVVEDLLFRSKISSAARALGVTVGAATTPDAAIARARAERPSVIILDLDSARTGPLEVLARLGADPELAAIPTLGFVSHVHADAIRSARAAGIGEVLARSAFAATLPDLLRRYERTT
ncbi:MAG: response regulator [Acidobacteriota bacterium]